MNVEIYLGDAVYAKDNGYEIVLWTSNGITKTNEIVLETEVMQNLLDWYKTRRIQLNDTNKD